MQMRLETSEASDGLLDVDAAYVLHLVGNGRLDTVRGELARRRPARVVHFVHNPGSQLRPAADIVEAYRYIFRHAQTQQYESILVLEDDFTWGRVTQDDGDRVSAFVKRHAARPFVYHLGCLPAMMMPVGGGAFWTLGCGTHASIYTKPCRERVLKRTRPIRDWDMYLFFHVVRLAYTKPLCHQLYGRTANSDQWLQCCGLTPLTPLVRLGLKMLLLDKRAEPGYSICYAGAKCVPFAGVALIIIAVVYGPRAWRLVKKYAPYNPNPNPNRNPNPRSVKP